MQEAIESQKLSASVEEDRGGLAQKLSSVHNWRSLRRISKHWLLPSPAYGRRGGMKRALWPLGLGLFYVLWIAWMGGLRPDHVFIGCLSLLDLYNQKSRKFLREFFPFILTGVIYDALRYAYPYVVTGRVHVAGPYLRDLRWFGLRMPENPNDIVTPNEFLLSRRNRWLDLLCGFAYLVFVAEYLTTAFYLFFLERWRTLKTFGLCFLSVNLLGYITYFLYPAAPPWYVSKYGFAPAPVDLLPEPAGAHRFDQLLGTHFFDEMYRRNLYVYGAYPSLHVSYPLLVLWVCMMRPELKWFRLPAFGFYLLMCFSAVYLQHHYVVDILLGSSYAVLVALAATYLLKRTQMRPMAGH